MSLSFSHSSSRSLARSLSPILDGNMYFEIKFSWWREYFHFAAFVMATLQHTRHKQKTIVTGWKLLNFIETNSLIPWETRVMHTMPLSTCIVNQILFHEFKWRKHVRKIFRCSKVSGFYIPFNTLIHFTLLHQLNEHFTWITSPGKSILFVRHSKWFNSFDVQMKFIKFNLFCRNLFNFSGKINWNSIIFTRSK